MSKCRPEVGLQFNAIADFLRSIHINGQPLRLPERIEEIHTHPRLELNMIKAFDVASLEQTANVFEGTEAITGTIQNSIATLDKRLQEVLARLEKEKS